MLFVISKTDRFATIDCQTLISVKTTAENTMNGAEKYVWLSKRLLDVVQSDALISPISRKIIQMCKVQFVHVAVWL